MFSPTLKRALAIIGLLAIAILLGYLLFRIFQKSAPLAPTPSTGKPGTTGQLPSSGQRPSGAGTTTTGGQLPSGSIITNLPPGTPNTYYEPTPTKQIINSNVAFTSLNSSGALRYYNSSDGKFYRLTATGEAKEMSGQIFYNVQKTTWAKNADKAILEYPDSSKILYNFDKKTQISIPKHWEDFSFSPDSQKFASKSIGLAPENRWLITTNSDGTGTELIEPMGENADKVMVDWSPSRQTVAFSMTGAPLGAERKEVLFIGLNGENFKSAIVEGEHFKPQWSPSGQKLLYSVDSSRSDYKPELWITDSYGDNIGNNRQTLKLNTWADKCIFQSDNIIYCAVPRSLPQGAGILPEVAAGVYDDIYKVDLKTGLRVSVPVGGDYQINQLSYDANDNRLLFTAADEKGVFELKM